MKRREFMERAGILGFASTLAPISSSGNPLPFSTESVASGETSGAAGADGTPISIHPENPKYFLFRGKPLVLIAASEHYGSVVNRRFDFERYLAEAADKKQTMTRTFLLYRELQSARNPCSPVKPESPDFVAPWPRTGPGKAMDGEPKYDLDRWNPEYFSRLHRFLSLASSLGIAVELTVFSNTYSNDVWALNPLRDRNNLQGIGSVEWPEYISLRDQKLVERQSAYARKIVQETSRYDNLYYEICNEPGGGVANHVTTREVDAWQQAVADTLRDELRKLNRQHLLMGQNAFSYMPKFGQNFDVSFSGSMLDAVNVHPLPNLTLRGRTYQLGNFMSKELQLEQCRDFFLATHREPKPCISDEDNAASMYLDDAGWTIDRKRAWIAVLCGAHYDFIDFSIKVGIEIGTQESRTKIRSWMRNLSEFIHSFDFIHAQPAPDWIVGQPAHLVTAALAKPGEDYIAYLADARELTDPTAGQPIRGDISFRLPQGNYRVCLYSPTGGTFSPCLPAEGGRVVTFELAPFTEDIVIRATRVR
jgi:hypothetical protein